MKKITAIIEMAKDGWCSVAPLNSSELEYGIMGEGRTPNEAIADFQRVYEAMKTRYAELDKRFSEAEFSYAIDTRSFTTYYANFFTLAGMERITGVNQRQLSHYINGVSKPRPSTSKKIFTAMQAFFANALQANKPDICFATS